MAKTKCGTSFSYSKLKRDSLVTDAFLTEISQEENSKLKSRARKAVLYIKKRAAVILKFLDGPKEV